MHFYTKPAIAGLSVWDSPDRPGLPANTSNPWNEQEDSFRAIIGLREIIWQTFV